MEPGHWIVITLIIAWGVAMVAGAWQANQKELMKHRERLALIDKGLPLPPEASPTASVVQNLMGLRPEEDPAARALKTLGAIRFLGIVTMGAGVGLFFLLVIIDRWERAVGIGGLMLIVGATLVLTTMRAVRVRGDR